MVFIKRLSNPELPSFQITSTFSQLGNWIINQWLYYHQKPICTIS